jgi:hypothetical protein
MSKRALATALTLALTMLMVGIASAQTPYIAVYFNAGHSQEAKDCPGPGPVVDTWYIAALNFNMFLSGAEFMVSYPPAVTWLADAATPPVTLGNTPTGITMGFPFPQNGFNTVDLCQVVVLWNCETCMDPYLNNLVRVIPHPGTGFLGAVDYPGFNLVPSVGLTAVLCACTIPTEQTTWGQVKSLYNE